MTRHGNSTGVICHRDFEYLLSMENGVPYHLGYVVSTTLHHQATNSRVRVIFARPHIMLLTHEMYLLEGVDQIQWVGGFTPIK